MPCMEHLSPVKARFFVTRPVRGLSHSQLTQSPLTVPHPIFLRWSQRGPYDSTVPRETPSSEVVRLPSEPRISSNCEQPLKSVGAERLELRLASPVDHYYLSGRATSISTSGKRHGNHDLPTFGANAWLDVTRAGLIEISDDDGETSTRSSSPKLGSPGP